MLIKSYVPILMIIITSMGIFGYYIKYENIKQEYLLEQEQLYQNLLNDTYVLDRIKDKLIGYDYIILQSPINLSEKMGGSLDYYDLVKNFTSMPTSHVRFFIAYQHIPDKINPMEKNHFYIGFIDMRGDVYHLPRDSLLYDKYIILYLIRILKICIKYMPFKKERCLLLCFC